MSFTDALQYFPNGYDERFPERWHLLAGILTLAVPIVLGQFAPCSIVFVAAIVYGIGLLIHPRRPAGFTTKLAITIFAILALAIGSEWIWASPKIGDKPNLTWQALGLFACIIGVSLWHSHNNPMTAEECAGHQPAAARGAYAAVPQQAYASQANYPTAPQQTYVPQPQPYLQPQVFHTAGQQQQHQ